VHAPFFIFCLRVWVSPWRATSSDLGSNPVVNVYQGCGHPSADDDDDDDDDGDDVVA